MQNRTFLRSSGGILFQIDVFVIVLCLSVEYRVYSSYGMYSCLLKDKNNVIDFIFSFVCRILAYDDDFTEEFNTVTYWIDPPSDQFFIDPSTGKIYLITPVDYENQTKYDLEVN